MKFKEFLSLLFILLLSGCANKPAVITEIELSKIPTIIESYEKSIEIFLTPAEKVVQQIKQNGNEIEKYFIIDKNKNIVIKANAQYENEKFDIVYYLEEIKKTGNYLYEVPFTVYNSRTKDIYNDTLLWNIIDSDSDSGLLLSFDDDYFNRWEDKFDLFDKYSAKVTFFIQGARFDAFYFKAVNRGHDVGYHTLNHPDLRKVSRDIFFKETISFSESIKQKEITFSSFAYPYGFFEPWMHNTLLKTFNVLRGYGTTFRLFTKDEINGRYISSYAIDNILFPEEEDFNRYISLMLRTVKFIDKDMVFPLTTHDISEAAWGISHERLEYLLKTTNDLKLTFYRFSDFAEE